MDADVFVYRNLHKNCFSCKSIKTGRVIHHADSVLLYDAKFVVSEKGRQRVIKEKRKNVHAGVRGKLVTIDKDIDEQGMLGVTYDPYSYDSFVFLGTKSAVLIHPGFVYCKDNKVYVA